MTISSTNRKAGPYSGNDSTTVFPFAFNVFESGDVYVVRADSSGAETVLVLDSGYTVLLNADQDANPGGSVTLPAVLATGYTLVIASKLENLQTTELTSQGGFYPKVITNALDRLTILVQQIDEKVRRAVKYGITSTLPENQALPAPVPYALIGWNATGDGFQNTDPTYSTALATDLASAASGKGASLVGYPTTGETVAAALNARLPEIGSYAALRAYAGPLTAFYVRGVASIFDGGAGVFRVDSSDTTSQDNGGTIIVGADGRRWKREFAGAANVKWFGAKGDGVTDDTAAIQGALTAAKSALVPAGDFLATELTLASARLIGEGPTSIIRKIGEGNLIKAYGALGASHALAGAPVIGSKTIQLASATGDFVVGEWAILESNDAAYLSGGDSGYAGEIVLIEAISGATVTVHAPIIWAYTLGNSPRLRKVAWNLRPAVENLRIIMNPNADADLYYAEAHGIEFRFCLNPVVRNCEISDGKQSGAQFTGCVQGLAENNYIHDLASADDDVTGGFGYGVHERAANIGLVVTGNRFARVRTGYTTGFGFSSVYRVGVPVGTSVIGNSSMDTFQSGMSTHEAGIYTQFLGNIIQGCRSMGINLRSKFATVRGNTISNCIGAGVQLVASTGIPIEGCVVDGNTITRTNLGTNPQGVNHIEYGAINDNSPDAVISNNRISYCGGPAIRTSSTRRTVVRGNQALNPCQLIETAIRKYAFGSDTTGGAGGTDFVLMQDNSCISTDGKVVNLISKPINLYIEGGGNIGRGHSGSDMTGETGGNYALLSGGSRANRVNFGYRVTIMLASDTLNLEQADVRSGIIIVNAETGSGGVDDLWTITGGMEGTELILRAASGNTITVKNGAGTTANNIRTASGADLVLNSATQLRRFVKVSGLWVQTQ